MTRIIIIDVYHTIHPFRRNHGRARNLRGGGEGGGGSDPCTAMVEHCVAEGEQRGVGGAERKGEVPFPRNLKGVEGEVRV